jgi:DNA primase
MGLELAAPPKRLRLDLLPEFKPLAEQGVRPLAAPFWDYLRDRGYTSPQVNWLVFNYRLHYATRGPYRYRIIIPIEDVEGRLQTWTGRSIVPGGTPRYKTLSATGRYGPDEPVALKGPTDMLLGLPLLLRVPNPQTLVLCEGPFDAMRITTLGRQYGVYGTCLFGLNISEAQVTLLDRLMSRFNRLVLLLDPDARHLTLRIKEHLTPLPVVAGVLPAGVEDPGALPVEQGRQLVQTWL